jgi:hypothetical protein
MDFGSIDPYIMWGLSVTGGIVVTFYTQTKKIVEKDVAILLTQKMKEFEKEFKTSTLRDVERMNELRFGSVLDKLDTISKSIEDMKSEQQNIKSDIIKSQKELIHLQLQVTNNTNKINKHD